MTKIIQIGHWDENQKTVELDDNATVRDALRIAKLTPSRNTQLISHSDAMPIEIDEVVRDGETYVLTSNDVSGIL